MSTDVNNIKVQVQDLISDLANNNNYDKSLLEAKYNYLYVTSKTLFDFIVKNIKEANDKFDMELFNLNLNQMLNYIVKIQNNELTQNDASESVGSLLANQFIPQCRKN